MVQMTDTAKNHKTSAIGQQQRTKILDAAEREFDQHGYGGARIQRIADLAKVPKSNVHYYFSGKQALYNAVLERIVGLWDQTFVTLDADDDPATVLEDFIVGKVEFTRLYPEATRIFTSEVQHGAPHLDDYLKNRMTTWTQQRASVIDQWIAMGKIKPLNALHLIFMIWASTQHFAQAEIQIRSIYGKPRLNKQDFDQHAESLVNMVFRICGLEHPSPGHPALNSKSTTPFQQADAAEQPNFRSL